MNNILILGNGFDLDLGLKTKYSDFAASDEWKVCANEESNLYKYLEGKNKPDRWFDLEAELLNYATTINPSSMTFKDILKEDELYFNQLHEGIKIFLDKQQLIGINVDSCAAKLLKAVVENGLFRNIYSFNYTNLNIYAKQLGIEIESKCNYIHGSLSDASHILGVNEDKIADGYGFLRKTMSSHYRPHNLFEDLKAADEVIFFGLSFGEIDFHYFEDFFKNLINKDVALRKKKHVTLFTKDESSRKEFLFKLDSKGIKPKELFSQSDFRWIRTFPSSEEDMDTLNKLFERLKKYNYSNTLISRLIS